MYIIYIPAIPWLLLSLQDTFHTVPQYPYGDVTDATQAAINGPACAQYHPFSADRLQDDQDTSSTLSYSLSLLARVAAVTVTNEVPRTPQGRSMCSTPRSAGALSTPWAQSLMLRGMFSWALMPVFHLQISPSQICNNR